MMTHSKEESYNRNTDAVMLAIAASDSCGGAGIQADIKTATRIGVYAASALTAVTVQDTRSVKEVWPVGSDIIYRQICIVAADLHPSAVKIGLLPDAEAAEAVARGLADSRLEANSIVDPVAIASSGDSLTSDATSHLEALKRLIFPKSTLVTPNLPEMKTILGHDFEDAYEACRSFLSRFGSRAVCLKGGHSADTSSATDIFMDADGHSFEIKKQRISTRNSHGTGCTFSSAIASFLALGLPLCRAVEEASHFTSRLLALSADHDIGGGCGCMSFHINSEISHQQ